MFAPLLRAPHVILAASLAIVAVDAGAATKSKTSAPASPAAAPRGPKVEEHILSNGMKLLLIENHLAPTISCGWTAHVGSVNERPGITGISHLFEHMMFKGTHVIGTRDYEKDVRLIEEQERVQDQMRAEISKMRAAQRLGVIVDMTRPEAKTERYKQLEARFDSLVAEQRANMVKNEYDKILSKNGATVTNAFTSYDLTFYVETLPANKIELWLWLESDRLKNRVFREFYSERDVVYEERRRSVESTPTGKFQEAFDAQFWDASPYGWPVLGWPSDVAMITKAQADDYYDIYYAPQNITAVLVGDFEPKAMLAMAEKYLGSIPRGKRTPPEMITMEPPSLAEKRFYGEAETNPAVTMRWHTVANMNKDDAPLEVLANILNGSSGRLHRNLVLGDGPATGASASSQTRKYEGYFEIEAECKDGRSPEQLETAVDTELDKLKKAPVTPDELQMVKNRYLASTYRQLSSNFQLMIRYGYTDALGDWRDADRSERLVQAVTAGDVQRVAKSYFAKENRAVAIWTRKAGAEAEDPAIAALPADAKPMVKQMLAGIEAATDKAQIQQMLARMDQMSGQMPAEMKPALDYVRAKAEARMTELSK